MTDAAKTATAPVIQAVDEATGSGSSTSGSDAGGVVGQATGTVDSALGG